MYKAVTNDILTKVQGTQFVIEILQMCVYFTSLVHVLRCNDKYKTLETQAQQYKLHHDVIFHILSCLKAQSGAVLGEYIETK